MDNLSSAHVYLRLAPGQAWDEVAQALVEDCAQLTKANSIEGTRVFGWTTTFHQYEAGRHGLISILITSWKIRQQKG